MPVEVSSGEDFAVLVSVVWGVVTWVNEVVVVRNGFEAVRSCDQLWVVVGRCCE